MGNDVLDHRTDGVVRESLPASRRPNGVALPYVAFCFVLLFVLVFVHDKRGGLWIETVLDSVGRGGPRVD